MSAGIRINPDILDGVTRRRVSVMTPEDAWRMYAPPRTWGATEEYQLAMDDHLQSCGYSGLIQHAIGLGMGLEEIAPQFLGYPYLAGLSQNALIRAGVTTIAEDMTKNWIEVRRSSKNIIDSTGDGIDDKVQAITTAINDFNLQTIFNEAAQKCDFDGGCLVYIDTGEADRGALEKPLVLDPQVFRGRTIKRFTLVEAINLYPGLYDATDPLDPDYFNPTTWLVLGKRIHKSRFLYFAPNKVPMILRPAYNFFGIPKAQEVLDYVAHFTKTREAAQRLLTKFSLTVFQSDMTAILSEGSSEHFDRRMQYLTQWRDNDMILAIDKEKENVLKLETPLSGTTDIVRQSLEFVAAIFRIPFVKFLGISPGGLNATGEADLRNYYDHVAGKQEKIFRKPLDTVLDLIQLHLFGEIDPEIKADFAPLSDEDDAQRANTQKLKADRLVVLVQGGIISEDEARRALVDDPDSDLGFIDPDAVPSPPEGEGEESFMGGMESGEGYEAASDEDTDEKRVFGVLEHIKRFFSGGGAAGPEEQSPSEEGPR